MSIQLVVLALKTHFARLTTIHAHINTKIHPKPPISPLLRRTIKDSLIAINESLIAAPASVRVTPALFFVVPASLIALNYTLIGANETQIPRYNSMISLKA
jgi:hypothetical protein